MGDEQKADDVRLKHLEMLTGKMSALATEIHQFAAKFLFGGAVAVMALLNTDLLIREELNPLAYGRGVLIIAIILILTLSGIYFYFVADRLRHLRRSLRSTKHKYEVTLYALLLGGSANEFIRHLERSVKKSKGSSVRVLPDNLDFGETMEYLHFHHQGGYRKLTLWRDWLAGMSIVLLVLLVKTIHYLFVHG